MQPSARGRPQRLPKVFEPPPREGPNNSGTIPPPGCSLQGYGQNPAGAGRDRAGRNTLQMGLLLSGLSLRGPEDVVEIGGLRGILPAATFHLRSSGESRNPFRVAGIC
mgnify:CR=1 FL=1